MSFQSNRPWIEAIKDDRLRSALQKADCLDHQIPLRYLRSSIRIQNVAVPEELKALAKGFEGQAAHFARGRAIYRPLAYLLQDLAVRCHCRTPSRQITYAGGVS